MRVTLRCLSAGALLLLTAMSLPATGHAEIVRIVIDRRAPLRDAAEPLAAQYEEIRGRLFGEIDPKNPDNALIQDIELAPLNARGRVEYISTFTLVRPLAPSKNSRVLLDSIPNRGGRGVLSARDGKVDPAYYDRGYSVIWIGWQGDLPERPSAQKSAELLDMESILVPRARRKDGSPVLGRYVIRVPTLGGDGPTGALMKLDQGRAGALAYMPASFDTRKATLTGGPAEDMTGKPKGRRYRIDPAEWTWWNCTKNSPADTAAIAADLCVKRLRGEFNPDETYLLVFTARDPLILALGMAATRDAISFFRYAGTGSVDKMNPLAGQIDYVVGQGQSQVGNLVKTFIALGFNQDESGRIVWDGANAHIAGRRTPLNYRFSTPGSSPTLFMPGSEGVLWWGESADALRGGPPRSMLDRCHARHTCPKIFETFGGAELWNQRMTPGMVNFDLKSDIALPENVRRYYFPGTQHGGGRGGFALTGSNVAPVDRAGSQLVSCTLPLNPNPEKDQMRALTVALIDWVSKGTPPPDSRYPTLARGELVKDSVETYAFPNIPGAPKPFGLANPVVVYDYGKQFDYVDMSGVMTTVPPEIKGIVPALVAQVDADGNETSGAPSVQHMAPLGTYLSWNTYDRGPYAGQICSYYSGFVPFSRTRAERTTARDPRASLEERYQTRAGYIAAVKTAVEKSVRERFLLAQDGDRLIEEAKAATVTGELNFLP
jgi:Alpha/beta hydrolase domain